MRKIIFLTENMLDQHNENYKEAFKYYNEFISSYTKEDEYLKYARERMEQLKEYAS